MAAPQTSPFRQWNAQFSYTNKVVSYIEWHRLRSTASSRLMRHKEVSGLDALLCMKLPNAYDGGGAAAVQAAQREVLEKGVVWAGRLYE